MPSTRPARRRRAAGTARRRRRRRHAAEARHLIALRIHALRIGDVVTPLQAEIRALGLVRADGAADGCARPLRQSSRHGHRPSRRPRPGPAPCRWRRCPARGCWPPPRRPQSGCARSPRTRPGPARTLRRAYRARENAHGRTPWLDGASGKERESAHSRNPRHNLAHEPLLHREGKRPQASHAFASACPVLTIISDSRVA